MKCYRLIFSKQIDGKRKSLYSKKFKTNDNKNNEIIKCIDFGYNYLVDKTMANNLIFKLKLKCLML
jgi:hypothetical protein